MNKAYFLVIAALLAFNNAAKAQVTISQIGVDYFHTANSGQGPNIDPFAPFSANDIDDDYAIDIFRHEEFAQTSAIAHSSISVVADFTNPGDLRSIMMSQYVSSQGIVSLQYHANIRLTINSGVMAYFHTLPVVGTNPPGIQGGSVLSIGLELGKFVPPNSYIGNVVGLNGTTQEYSLDSSSTYRISYVAGNGARTSGETRLNALLVTFGSPATETEQSAFQQFASAEAVPEPSAALFGILAAFA